MRMDNDYEARVFLPNDLAPKVWALVGGESVSDLRRGIVRACELATANQTLWTHNDGGARL